MSKIDKSFGVYLKKIRDKHGLTQVDLAERIQKIYRLLEDDEEATWPTNSMVSQWEKGYDKLPAKSFNNMLSIVGTLIELGAINNNEDANKLIQYWTDHSFERHASETICKILEIKFEDFYIERAIEEEVGKTPDIKEKTKNQELPSTFSNLSLQHKRLIYVPVSLFMIIIIIIVLIASGLLDLRFLYSQNVRHQIVSQEIDGAEMVFVPSGCFMMGHEDGRSDRFINVVHEQCFEYDFWIDRFEVTNAVYGTPSSIEGDCDFERDSNGEIIDRRVGGDEPDRPRNCVTWFEARDFCVSRNARLPTEAEWEYAARGSDNWIYPWGNEFDSSRANIRTQGVYFAPGKDDYPTGQSWVGAYNMSGGLYEWVNSMFGAYPYEPSDGREDMEDTESPRVIRGGSWDWFEVNNGNLIQSSYYRSSIEPNTRGNSIGFRCVINADRVN